VTEATVVRPTRAGTIKFAMFYAAMIAIPLAVTTFLIQGVSLTALVGVGLGYLVAVVAFAGLVGAGFFGLMVTDTGLRMGSRRARELPWSEVDRIETGRFLGREIWVRVEGRPDESGKRDAFAVVAAFLFSMSAPELRDYLVALISQRTGSPT
jgi:hypothetical protein